MRRTFAQVVMSSQPAAGVLRPYLVAVFAIMAVPNVSYACAMYMPEDMQLVAQAGSLDSIFADIDAAFAPDVEPTGAERLREQVVTPVLPSSTRDLLLQAAPDQPAADATADALPQT